MNLRNILIYIFLMAKNVEYFLSGFSAIWHSSVDSFLFYIIIPFLNWCNWIASFFSSLYVSDSGQPFSETVSEKSFQLCRLLFCPIGGILCLKLCSFMRFHLLIVNLSVWVIGILFRKLSPIAICSRQLSIVTSLRFSASNFIILWSFIHLTLSFVQGD